MSNSMWYRPKEASEGQADKSKKKKVRGKFRGKAKKSEKPVEPSLQEKKNKK